MEKHSFIRPLCPTCGRKIGLLEEPYEILLSEGYSPGEAMDKLGLTGGHPDQFKCCRARMMCPTVIPLGVKMADYYNKSELEEVNTAIRPKISMEGSLSSIRNKIEESYSMSKNNDKYVQEECSLDIDVSLGNFILSNLQPSRITS